MKRISSYIFIFLFLCLHLHGHAQSVEYQHQAFTMDDGLAANEVFCGLQDSRGFIWLGTRNGLNRFDGKNFTRIDKSYGRKKNQVVSLAEDKAGNIWILYGSREGLRDGNGQVDIYNPITDVITPFRLNTGSKEQDHIDIKFLLTDREKNIFFVNNEKIIYRLEDDLQVEKLEVIIKMYDDLFEILRSIPSTILNNKLVIGGQLIGEKYYLSYFNDQGNQEYISTLEKNDSLFLTIKESVDEQTQLTRFLHTDSITYSVLQGVLDPILAGGYQAKINPHSSSLFIRSQEQVYIFHDYKLTSLKKDAIEGGDLFHNINYFMDRQQNYWICSAKGLHKFSLSKRKFLNQFDKKSLKFSHPYQHQVRSIIADIEGNVWTGGDGGLTYYDQKDAEYKIPKNQTDNFVAFLLFEQNGRLDIFGGMPAEIDLMNENYTVVYHPKSNKELEIKGGFWSALQLSNEEYLLGARGLYTMDRTTDRFKKLKFCSDSFPPLGLSYKIIKYKDHYWCAGEHGVYVVSKDLCIIDYYGNTDGLDQTHKLPVSDFRDILIDDQGIIWLTTRSDGLVRWDKANHEFLIFGMEEGMPSNNLYCILPDDYGQLWISSDNGLIRFDKILHTISLYSEKDGLIENEFNRIASFKRVDGRLYFGSINGVTSFDPIDFVDQGFDQAIPLFVTSYYQFLSATDELTNETTTFRSTNEITLLPGDDFFRIEFALLDFTNPAKQYKYKIDGYDSKWIYLDEGALRVSGLPYGHFTLNIQGQSSSGVWSEQTLSIPIHVVKPFYLRWWAFVGYGLAFLLFLYYFRKYQIKNVLEAAEKEKLIEIDELKTKLYTNITHEFRTPLTVIMGMANQIVEDNKLIGTDVDSSPKSILDWQQKVNKRSGFILRNANNLLQLINQMLDLAKLDKAELTIDWEHSDIILFLNYITESFESYAQTEQVDLIFYPETNEIKMDFDRVKIQQIVSNLLSNAIKFTPKQGKVVFHVNKVPSQDAAEQNALQIKISNSGAGIPVDKLEKLFDRFYQVDDSLTRKSGGTGIGLSLAKELTELFGGRIKAESVIGQGATFTVTLPIHINKFASRFNESMEIPQPMKQVAAKSESKHEATVSEDTPLLLLVEDNADVAEYIRMCMADAYHVLWAENGQKGVDLAIEKTPDIIISDVMMPEKDGYELTNELKNDERTSHIPIILLTAKSSIESRVTGLKRGADAYLTKPFDKQELQIRVKNLIEIRRNIQSFYSSSNITKLIDKKVAKVAPQLASVDVKIEHEFLQKIHDIIEKELDNSTFEIASLCQGLGMSHSQVYRKLKALSGQTIVAYVRNYRLERAKEMLILDNGNVSEIAFSVGYTDPAYFSRQFSAKFGHPPIQSAK